MRPGPGLVVMALAFISGARRGSTSINYNTTLTSLSSPSSSLSSSSPNSIALTPQSKPPLPTTQLSSTTTSTITSLLSSSLSPSSITTINTNTKKIPTKQYSLTVLPFLNRSTFPVSSSVALNVENIEFFKGTWFSKIANNRRSGKVLSPKQYKQHNTCRATKRSINKKYPTSNRHLFATPNIYYGLEERGPHFEYSYIRNGIKSTRDNGINRSRALNKRKKRKRNIRSLNSGNVRNKNDFETRLITDATVRSPDKLQSYGLTVYFPTHSASDLSQSVEDNIYALVAENEDLISDENFDRKSLKLIDDKIAYHNEKDYRAVGQRSVQRDSFVVYNKNNDSVHAVQVKPKRQEQQQRSGGDTISISNKTEPVYSTNRNNSKSENSASLLRYRSFNESSHPLIRLNPWISACDLAQPGPTSAPDLQGKCSVGALPVAWVEEGPGPPTCPESCNGLALTNNKYTTEYNINSSNNNNSKSNNTNDTNINNNGNQNDEKKIVHNININKNKNKHINHNNNFSGKLRNSKKFQIVTAEAAIAPTAALAAAAAILSNVSNNNINSNTEKTFKSFKFSNIYNSNKNKNNNNNNNSNNTSNHRKRLFTDQWAIQPLKTEQNMTTSTKTITTVTTTTSTTTTRKQKSNIKTITTTTLTSSLENTSATAFDATVTTTNTTNTTTIATTINNNTAAINNTVTTNQEYNNNFSSVDLTEQDNLKEKDAVTSTTTPSALSVIKLLNEDGVPWAQSPLEASLTLSLRKAEINDANDNNYNKHLDQTYNYENYKHHQNRVQTIDSYRELKDQPFMWSTDNDKKQIQQQEKEQTEPCLEYLGDSERSTPKHLCDLSSSSERLLRLRLLRLRNCCERNVYSALHTMALNATLAGGPQCIRTLQNVIDLDALAERITCSLSDILYRFDCRQTYSIIHQCDDCREAYRRWVCSTLVPYFAEPSDVIVDNNSINNNNNNNKNNNNKNVDNTIQHMTNDGTIRRRQASGDEIAISTKTTTTTIKTSPLIISSSPSKRSSPSSSLSLSTEHRQQHNQRTRHIQVARDVKPLDNDAIKMKRYNHNDAKHNSTLLTTATTVTILTNIISNEQTMNVRSGKITQQQQQHQQQQSQFHNNEISHELRINYNNNNNNNNNNNRNNINYINHERHKRQIVNKPHKSTTTTITTATTEATPTPLNSSQSSHIKLMTFKMMAINGKRKLDDNYGNDHDDNDVSFMHVPINVTGNRDNLYNSIITMPHGNLSSSSKQRRKRNIVNHLYYENHGQHHQDDTKGNPGMYNLQQQQQSNNFISTANRINPNKIIDDSMIIQQNLIKRTRGTIEVRKRRRIRPCLSVCQTVEQKCPYLLPADRAPSLPTQYAGEPTFLCLDQNIPETGDQLEKSSHGPAECCYTYCGDGSKGLCTYCPEYTDNVDKRRRERRIFNHTLKPLTSDMRAPTRIEKRIQAKLRYINDEMQTDAKEDNILLGMDSVAIAIINDTQDSNASHLIERLPYYAFCDDVYYYDDDIDDMPTEATSATCQKLPTLQSRCTIPYYAEDYISAAAAAAASSHSREHLSHCQYWLLWLSILLCLSNSCNARYHQLTRCRHRHQQQLHHNHHHHDHRQLLIGIDFNKMLKYRRRQPSSMFVSTAMMRCHQSGVSCRGQNHLLKTSSTNKKINYFGGGEILSQFARRSKLKLNIYKYVAATTKATTTSRLGIQFQFLFLLIIIKLILIIIIIMIIVIKVLVVVATTTATITTTTLMLIIAIIISIIIIILILLLSLSLSISFCSKNSKQTIQQQKQKQKQQQQQCMNSSTYIQIRNYTNKNNNNNWWLRSDNCNSSTSSSSKSTIQRHCSSKKFQTAAAAAAVIVTADRFNNISDKTSYKYYYLIIHIDNNRIITTTTTNSLNYNFINTNTLVVVVIKIMVTCTHIFILNQWKCNNNNNNNNNNSDHNRQLMGSNNNTNNNIFNNSSDCKLFFSLFKCLQTNFKCINSYGYEKKNKTKKHCSSNIYIKFLFIDITLRLNYNCCCCIYCCYNSIHSNNNNNKQQASMLFCTDRYHYFYCSNFNINDCWHRWIFNLFLILKVTNSTKTTTTTHISYKPINNNNNSNSNRNNTNS